MDAIIEKGVALVCLFCLFCLIVFIKWQQQQLTQMERHVPPAPIILPFFFYIHTHLGKK